MGVGKGGGRGAPRIWAARRPAPPRGCAWPVVGSSAQVADEGGGDHLADAVNAERAHLGAEALRVFAAQGQQAEGRVVAAQRHQGTERISREAGPNHRLASAHQGRRSRWGWTMSPVKKRTSSPTGRNSDPPRDQALFQTRKVTWGRRSLPAGGCRSPGGWPRNPRLRVRRTGGGSCRRWRRFPRRIREVRRTCLSSWAIRSRIAISCRSVGRWPGRCGGGLPSARSAGPSCRRRMPGWPAGTG